MKKIIVFDDLDLLGLATSNATGYNPTEIIAILTKALQEQQAQITDLQNRVNNLEGK